jgi:Effector Associated Constant Component 1
MDGYGEGIELTVKIDPGPDADSIEIEELSRGLRDELLGLDVDQVTPAAVAAPEGAKAGDAVTWQTLLVTLSASGGVLTTVIAAVSEWLRRRQHPVSAVLKIGDDSLTLPAPTAEERSLLVETFVQRHQRR